MVGKDSSKAHCSGVQDRFMAEIAKACMAMHNLDLLSNDDIAEYRKEREDSRKGCLPVNNEERYMIDFETICQIVNTSPSFICMSDDDDFMAAIDEFLMSSDQLFVHD